MYSLLQSVGVATTLDENVGFQFFDVPTKAPILLGGQDLDPRQSLNTTTSDLVEGNSFGHEYS